MSSANLLSFIIGLGRRCEPYELISRWFHVHHRQAEKCITNLHGKAVQFPSNEHKWSLKAEKLRSRVLQWHRWDNTYKWKPVLCSYPSQTIIRIYLVLTVYICRCTHWRLSRFLQLGLQLHSSFESPSQIPPLTSWAICVS